MTNSQSDRYLIRRKVFKLLGASFHVYDDTGKVVAYTKQKAFKLREDIRVYTDESMAYELLSIRARQIIDFAAAYDVIDAATGSKVGAVRRKGFKSLVRDSWEVLDISDAPIARLQEDSTGLALLRRLLTNLIPQTFRLQADPSSQPVMFRQQFNPFVYKLEVEMPASTTLDRRLILATAVLLAAIEGRQD